MASAAQLAPIPVSKTKLFNSASKRTAVLSLALVMVTLVAYNPIVHNDFVNFDDPGYIYANPHIRAGLSWSTVKWAFRSTEQGNWHPLTWLSHALDYRLFHANPIGHHYMGALLHATAAVLLFLFLQAATGFAWRSLMVAALFALHPLNVESVAWASERKSVLCMIFFLLALMAYRWYAQHPGWKRYSMVALLFALGLMSKPMIVTLPFVLLLLDYWPLERTKTLSTSRLILEKLPLTVTSAASCVITMIAQKAEGAIHSSDFHLSNRGQNAILSYGIYLKKAVWPSKLASFYPHPEHIPALQLALAAILLASVTATVYAFRGRKYLLFGWAWFLGTMIPMIGLVQVGEQGMADRYAYLPLVGVFVAVIWATADWAKAQRISTRYLAIPACFSLLLFGAVTHHQIGYWKDTKTLWTHTLNITERNYMAEGSLGAELVSEGRLQEAVKHLQLGIAFNPRDPFSHLDLGVCYKQAGQLQEAVKEYETALSLTTGGTIRGVAYGNLGSAYAAFGNYPLAKKNYEQALQYRPDDFVQHIGLGVVEQKMGNLNAAIDQFSAAAKLQPGDVEFLLLSQALARMGRQKEAQSALQQAQSASQNWNATLLAVNRLLQH